MVAMAKGSLVFFRLNFLERNTTAVLMTDEVMGTDGVPLPVITLATKNGDFVQTEVNILWCTCYTL